MITSSIDARTIAMTASHSQVVFVPVDGHDMIVVRVRTEWPDGHPELATARAEVLREAPAPGADPAPAPEGWATGLLGARDALLVTQHRGTRWLLAARTLRSQMRRYGVGEAEIAHLDEAIRRAELERALHEVREARGDAPTYEAAVVRRTPTVGTFAPVIGTEPRPADDGVVTLVDTNGTLHLDRDTAEEGAA